MKYFKDAGNNIYAYDIDVNHDYVKQGLTEITFDSAYEILNPPPSLEQLVEQAEAERLMLRALADTEISWRQDAVDVGIATDDEMASLSEWKKYRVMVMRVDTSKPVWPQKPV